MQYVGLCALVGLRGCCVEHFPLAACQSMQDIFLQLLSATARCAPKFGTRRKNVPVFGLLVWHGWPMAVHLDA